MGSQRVGHDSFTLVTLKLHKLKYSNLTLDLRSFQPFSLSFSLAMLHGMYLSSLTMGRPKLPFTLIPTLPTTPHSPWKRGSMKPLPLNHWKSLSHYFFEGTFCLISLFSPSGRLIIDKLVLLMMYHRSCCFSSLFFILFSLFSSEWITSMYLLSVSQIPFSACFILQLMLCSCIFISSLDFSVPEFLFGSFI